MPKSRIVQAKSIGAHFERLGYETLNGRSGDEPLQMSIAFSFAEKHGTGSMCFPLFFRCGRDVLYRDRFTLFEESKILHVKSLYLFFDGRQKLGLRMGDVDPFRYSTELRQFFLQQPRSKMPRC